MAYVGISSGHCQPTKNVLHVGIILVHLVINAQNAVVVLITARLIEDAQHHVKPVVDITVQTGNLDDNAIVRQTVDKRVGKAFRHHVAIIVKRLVVDVKYRLFYVTNLVA